MKNWWKLTIVSLCVAGTGACATRYREASTGRTADEVASMLTEITSSASGSSPDAQAVLDMIRDNPEATVYFAEAPGALGPIHAVTPIDLGYLTGTEYGLNSLSEIRTFFVELRTEDGHKNALVVQYKLIGQSNYSTEVFTNFNDELGEIVEGSEFRSILSNSARSILVRSFDIDAEYEDELAPVIQLELSAFNEDGSEGQNLGQISSMEGFSIFF